MSKKLNEAHTLESKPEEWNIFGDISFPFFGFTPTHFYSDLLNAGINMEAPNPMPDQMIICQSNANLR